MAIARVRPMQNEATRGRLFFFFGKRHEQRKGGSGENEHGKFEKKEKKKTRHI